MTTRSAIVLCVSLGCAARSPETVRVTIGSSTAQPLLAVRDGDGPWQQLALVDGSASFSIRRGVYELAVQCSDDIQLVRATPAELATVPLPPCGVAVASIHIEIAGLAPGMHANTSAGVLDKVNDGDGPIELIAERGRVDVVVVEEAPRTEDDRQSRRILIERDLDAPSAKPIRFDMAKAVELERRAIAVTGAASDDRLVVEGRLVTARNAAIVLSVDSTPPFVADVIPPQHVAPGDAAGVMAFASRPHARRWVRGTGDLTLPAPLEDVQVELQPNLGVSFRVQRHARHPWYGLDIYQTASPFAMRIDVSARALGGGPQLAYTTPPPPPWFTRWIANNTKTNWELSATQGPDLGTIKPVAGAARSGTID